MVNNESAIVVESLSVRRGRRNVIRDLSLEVHAGRVTGLLGPSGSGKSTLIRALIGVQAGVRGTITLLGHPAGARALSRRVAYMSQSAAIYDDLSVIQNVAYFAAALGQRGAEVARVIEAVDLTEYAKTLVSRLSGGQRNRVALAVALLGRPEILVLDEPTVGLDPLLRRDLWELFRRVADDGAAVLVSSHVMDEAARCDDLILLRDGEVLAHDTLSNLYARTGTTDPEAVFLSLVDVPAAADDVDASNRDDAHAAPRPKRRAHAHAAETSSTAASEGER